ncbi:hypothetical protein TIFTF001_034712 [Ficus carica]|uniref:Uncharacterized protein n=1 Tax=Ficus carica TaxID=3494 RepID=A0AA88E484_FICCA|nr:hypothetical protein TIFTF001_034712 [Ficus carica]
MYICVHTGRTESQLIDSIVDDVKNKLNAMSVAGSKLRGLVGIVERIKEVEQLLQIGSLNKLGPIAERQRDLVAYLNQLEMKKKKKKKKKMMMMIMTITVVESLNQMIKKKITVNHSLRDLEHENHFSS